MTNKSQIPKPEAAAVTIDGDLRQRVADLIETDADNLDGGWESDDQYGILAARLRALAASIAPEGGDGGV